MRLPGLEGVSELLGDYRRFAGRRFAAALALMLAGAIAEGLGILSLVPLLALVSGSEDALALIEPVIGEVGLSQPARFAAALGLFLATMLARSILLYRRDRLLGELRAGYEASLKFRSAQALASLGWEGASKVGQAGMQSLLLTDIPRCAVAVYHWQIAMVSIVMLLVQFALAALLSPSMALIALVLVGGGLLASRVWLRRGSRSGREISAVHQRSAAAAFRLHAGLKAAMAQGTAPQFLREYRATLNDLSRELIVYDRDRSVAQNIASGGAALCAALLLVIGDRVLQLPFALLLTLIVLFSRMAGPALQFQQSLQGLSAHVPSFAQLRHRFGSSAAGAVAGADAAPLEWRELVLDRATYRHPGGEGGTQELSLSIASGEWVALSGPSGAGKTTAADLVAGLLRPQSGSVAVDGRRLAGETLDGWRRSLAYIGQTDTVFDDTVRGNLLAEGATADDAAMWSVLEAVGLGERIQAFPEQLDAQVGDRGSSLSGGERQRLTIARALLRNASLLILDEATNALDAAGEQSVLGHLRALQPRPAALLIAHRPGPLALCDRVVEIDKGRQAGS